MKLKGRGRRGFWRHGRRLTGYGGWGRIRSGRVNEKLCLKAVLSSKN